MLVCCSGRFSHLWQKDLHSFGVQPKPFPIQKQFKFALFSQIRNSVALRLFTLIPRLKIVSVSSCNTNLKILAKQAPLTFEQQDYQNLREQVLRRDGWRCRVCGSMANLEVHQKQFRSHCGNHDKRNLITLCFDCHGLIHGKSTRLTRLRILEKNIR